MPITVKSVAATVAKWVARTGVAANDYANGVANSQKDQAGLAAAAEPAWAAGVASAAQNKSFSKAVTAVGTAGWKAGVASKGASRYAPGTQAAQGKFSTKIAAVLSAIGSINLTQRYPRGDPRNQQRSVDVQVALHKLRTGG